ncbi:hypothetical protein Cylst_3404 [Cylindrospermum stagnale PCC 7417]|uniref:Uncharacterized protein n=1 Tax=Cylindrospermum stagnale PCC 7417 TaxID=56107 RepID=K9X0H0_9NOST|nr:hypothetical protein Cylst_3404 [Cylindrospermum stagnale PCC 7417]
MPGNIKSKKENLNFLEAPSAKYVLLLSHQDSAIETQLTPLAVKR